jgi:hypothetical protein
MERVMERGSKYPAAEKKRLKGMLKSGGAGLSGTKRTDMEERVNILTTFIRASLDFRYE